MKKLRSTKLNLGSGIFLKKGYVNVDYFSQTKPDVLHNLNKFPYPFPTNAFTLVEADHILEHLEDPFRVMQEIHRITSNGATVKIRVPHFSRGFTHPDHKRGFDVTFPYYFRREFKAGYLGYGFHCESMKFTWLAQPYLKKIMMPLWLFWIASGLSVVISFFANMSPFFCSRLWCFLVGGFEEIEFTFITKKPNEFNSET